MPKRGDDLEAVTADTVIAHLGEAITITSDTGSCSVRGIFRNPFFGVGVAELSVGSTDPTLQIKAGACASLKRGATFTRRGVTYQVFNIDTDNVMQTLQLHVV